MFLCSKIYFFDTPMCIKIKVLQTELSKNVIKHCMTLYSHSEFAKKRPLEFPDDPNRYQLFFIDEDESEHAPEYDMGPRNPEEPIGEFPSLAFVLNKKFKVKNQA